MQFRGYRVDSVHRTVTSPGGRVVRLEPKAFDLLMYFSEHPEELLSREQLIADVWGGKFVTNDAVMVAVYALRQAFDDDSRAPKFIETIRGRGYRWVATPATTTTTRPKRFVAMWAALIAIGFTALVWAVLRPPQAMPSIERTNELVRAHARGVFFSERTSRSDLQEARSEFIKAIRIDERFAEPHAALAQVDVRLVEIGAHDAKTFEADARQQAARAIELAPHSAIARAALATVQFVLDRDVPAAERSYRYAIDLDPTLPGIHRRYSYLLGATGRFAEATEQARIATELDPASAGAVADLAWANLLNGRAAEAERLYRDAIHLDPANTGALIALGFCLEMRNAPDAAMQQYRRALQLNHVPDDAIAAYDRAFATSGLPGLYAEYLQRLKPNQAIPRMIVAMYAARAGRSAEALELLRESMRLREPGNLWLGVHPAFASLRHQREFAGLVASSFQTR